MTGLIGLRVDKVDTVDNFHLYILVFNDLQKHFVNVDNGGRQRKKSASSTQFMCVTLNENIYVHNTEWKCLCA